MHRLNTYMKTTLADKSIAWLTLLSGLSISVVAVYYSVAGLISIFSASVIPIAIMGTTLELSKLIATVWLKQNWTIAPRLIKMYLLIAIGILMFITSMGIFGFLARAHLDHGVPTGDIADKIAIIDEKVKTQKENIESSKKALQQMDAAVDQLMSRTTDAFGATKSAQLRKAQLKERTTLQNDISVAQTNISKLNDERAPLTKDLRLVESEVGPIKYIAAMMYGDNPDVNTLERAVRWVIILIVIVFDPLAVILLLSSQYSFQYFRKVKEKSDVIAPVIDNVITHEVKEPVISDIVESISEPIEHIVEPVSNEVEEVSNPICEIEQPVIKPFSDIKYSSAITSWKLPSNNILPIKQEVINKVEEQPAVSTPLVVEDMHDEHIEPIVVDTYESHPLDDNEPVHDVEKVAKAEWKAEHQDDTIKRQEKLYELGLIEQLPWQVVEELDAAKSNIQTDISEEIDILKKKVRIHDEGSQSPSTENARVEYVQNSEQSSNSLWNRIQHKVEN